MQDPHAILGLERDADEEAIRARYLVLVRRYSPEREPEKAAEIRAAYDALRDPIERLRRQLFDIQCTITFEGLIEEHSALARGRRLPTQLLLSLGQS